MVFSRLPAARSQRFSSGDFTGKSSSGARCPPKRLDASCGGGGHEKRSIYHVEADGLYTVMDYVEDHHVNRLDLGRDLDFPAASNTKIR